MRPRPAATPLKTYDQHAAIKEYRSFLCRVTASDPLNRRVGVRLLLDNQPVQGVRILRPRRCNTAAILEEMPEVGDLGLIKYAHGNTREPIWEGWIDPDDNSKIIRGKAKSRRTLYGGVETTMDLDDSGAAVVTVRTKVSPDGKQAEGAGVVIKIGADDKIAVTAAAGISIDVPADKLITIGSGSEEVLVKKSWLVALEAKVNAMDTAIGSGLTGVGIGSAASGTLGKTAYDGAMTTARTTYTNATKGVTKKLKGG